jgi:hypothetical protein
LGLCWLQRDVLADLLQIDDVDDISNMSPGDFQDALEGLLDYKIHCGATLKKGGLRPPFSIITAVWGAPLLADAKPKPVSAPALSAEELAFLADFE